MLIGKNLIEWHTFGCLNVGFPLYYCKGGSIYFICNTNARRLW